MTQTMTRSSRKRSRKVTPEMAVAAERITADYRAQCAGLDTRYADALASLRAARAAVSALLNQRL